MFMLDRFVLDTCVYLPVEIFTAPDHMHLADLVQQLQLEKGEGGSPLQLMTGQERTGKEKFPSCFLLQRDEAGGLVIMGTLAHRFSSCKDFAVITSEVELANKARSIAAYLMHYDPSNPEDYQRYATIALAREG